MFLTEDDAAKLDKNDASFVEVIHTDDLGMGVGLAQGNVDIYFNGGSNQPGLNSPSILVDPVVQSAQLLVGGQEEFQSTLCILLIYLHH